MARSGLELGLPTNGGPLRVLAIGAHADDLEIGAAGTVARLVDAMPEVEIHWIVLSAAGVRAEEARASAERLLDGITGCTIEVERFRERYLHLLPELKEWFDALGARIAAPDLIVGPRLADAHQDHRVVAELIRQTFRAAPTILEYEIPKLEGDLGRPNLFVELPEAAVDAKLDHLEASFPSQRDRVWFRRDLLRGLMAMRGMEAGSASGYAEGFTASRIRLGLPTVAVPDLDTGGG